eukprot:47850-Rhodomonas_salina.4
MTAFAQHDAQRNRSARHCAMLRKARRPSARTFSQRDRRRRGIGDFFTAPAEHCERDTPCSSSQPERDVTHWHADPKTRSLGACVRGPGLLRLTGSAQTVTPWPSGPGRRALQLELLVVQCAPGPGPLAAHWQA